MTQYWFFSSVAFQFDLHCLPKYLFMSIQYHKGNRHTFVNILARPNRSRAGCQSHVKVLGNILKVKSGYLQWCTNFVSFFSSGDFLKNLLEIPSECHFARPGLGPNCLKSLSADHTSRQRVKISTSIATRYKE